MRDMPANQPEPSLRERAREFGYEFEWPYRFILDRNRSPADQQHEAQEKLLDEFMATIEAGRDVALREAERRQPPMTHNELREQIKTQLSYAYCNGLDRKGWSEHEEANAVDTIMQLFAAFGAEVIREDVKPSADLVHSRTDMVNLQNEQRQRLARLVGNGGSDATRD